MSGHRRSLDASMVESKLKGCEQEDIGEHYHLWKTQSKRELDRRFPMLQ